MLHGKRYMLQVHNLDLSSVQLACMLASLMTPNLRKYENMFPRGFKYLIHFKINSYRFEDFSCCYLLNQFGAMFERFGRDM